jgi:hypothetical protein
VSIGGSILVSVKAGDYVDGKLFHTYLILRAEMS